MALPQNTQAKKRATEVAQNALRARYRKDLRFFAFMRIFPDEKSKPGEKQNHEADSQHSGDYHIVEKHDWPPALALLRWG
ncbi:hypothetical protein IMY95_17110 [Pseudomonas chlororaphis]|nr:hypothetical protein [Pseudomonas chlororaphis]MBM0283551.1 hypothetical protein [Pseudomonas chlororaphis]MDO1503876.1 hypothetical protein [Pseudomonas chlororaphis]WDH01047.1 hypothetical protein PUP54_05110 [Pseudomonas chlororaphis]WDH19684.1 hypothetical protein PUP70_07610 [Pseudomonas chlororaphis]WDH68261.1 hypothetical protein PUP71_11470 [Pseudomonas chlororaphis]